MSENLTSLDGTLDAVWARLIDGVNNPGAPGRNVALATSRISGGGAVRIVVLRKADRDSDKLVFFTHRASAKVSELQADPQCEALIWDSESLLQIRIRLTAEISDGPADLWKSFGPGSRRNYAGTPLPGTPLQAAADFDPDPAPDQFVLITAKIIEIETLSLASDPQRRALFTNERTSWIAP